MDSVVPGRRSQLQPQQFAGLVRNISNVYSAASPETRAEGVIWYPKAYDTAADLGRYRGGVERAAGVIAAMSPQTGWEHNIKLARNVLSGERTGHTHPQMEKAFRIMAGESPLDVLHGNKERSFYRNIVNPDDPEPITVDRHAHDIAVATKLHDDSDRGLRAVGRYGIITDAYRTAAQRFGIAVPNRMQAATWLQWRAHPPAPR